MNLARLEMFEKNETLEEAVRRNVEEAFREDLGTCDWTAQLVPAGRKASATVVARDEQTVICGIRWFEAAVRRVDPTVDICWTYEEGDVAPKNKVICKISGDSRALLTAERTALNFLQLLSGVATKVRRLVGAVGGKCAILDTRKTLPGLRLAQKYAVRVGGGKNQRLGLYDGILIKENHILAAGGVREVLEAAKNLSAGVGIQIEVENLDQLHEALDAGAESIMLDNFDLEGIRKAVAINNGKAVLEVSGGVDMDRLPSLADTGVDRISLGTLTKDVKAADFSWRFCSVDGGGDS